MNKLQNIQALRGIAVLCVVFFHLLFIESKYGGRETVLPGWLGFGMFGVDLFFVISGFVMATVTRGKFQSLKQSLRFLYHRISRIYPLYWVYTTLAFTVFLIIPSWVNSSQGNQVNIPASYLLLPDNLLPLVQVGWTLIHEMYFYLVFFLLLLFLPERFLVTGIFLWGIVITIFGSSTGNAYYNVVFHPLTWEFLAGCLLAVHYHNGKSVKANGRILALIAAAGLTVSILGFASLGAQPERWMRLFYYGIPAVVIVFCLVHAERNEYILPRWLIQTGDASYSIYLSHLFTINVVGRLWSLIAAAPVLDNIIALPVIFTFALAAGFVSYQYIETPLLKLTRRLA